MNSFESHWHATVSAYCREEGIAPPSVDERLMLSCDGETVSASACMAISGFEAWAHVGSLPSGREQWAFETMLVVSALLPSTGECVVGWDSVSRRAMLRLTLPLPMVDASKVLGAALQHAASQARHWRSLLSDPDRAAQSLAPLQATVQEVG